MLLFTTVGLFGFNYSHSPTLWLAIFLCLVNSLEEIAMALILPQWHCDVLRIFPAIELRRSAIDVTSD